MDQTTAGFHLSPQQKLLSPRAPLERAELVLLLEGPLNSARLHSAIHQLTQRHEILRTTYQRSAGMLAPFQVVNDTPQLETKLETVAPDRHILTLHLPALSADLASFHHLFLELVSLYQGKLLSDTLQYADYSEWHNELLQKTDSEAVAGKNFWAQRDPSAIPPLLLPFQKTETGPTRESVAIGKLTAEPDTLLAAWQILLWRLTGQPEIVVGRVIEGRNHEEFTNGIGLYEKVVLEYANFENDPTFNETIAQAEHSRGETALWEDYLPLAHPANLTAGFRFEQRPGLQLAGGVSFSITSHSVYSPFAIELRAVSTGTAELVYHPAAFHQTDVLRLARRLTLLLAGDPQTPASALPLMDDEERNRILNEFNRTPAEYPRTQCFHQLFEAQAAKTPAAPALRFETTELTYAELNTRANQLAHGLRARGIQANVPVGLLMERSADMIVALLGILKAGGCYVPLLSDHPKRRIDHQIAETGAPIILTHATLPEISKNQPSENPALNTTPEDLVYIIYTSGSTGIPKGVAVTHANLVNYSSFIVKRLGAAEGWNFATVSTLSADLGNTSIFPALLSGGCLNVIGFETAMNASLYTATHPIDVLKITPSHLATLLDAGGTAVLPRRFLISGGEALSFALLHRIREAGTCTVLNHYGPTEATIGCCTFDASTDATSTDLSQWQPDTVPIGRPIDNDEVYILDSHLQPVPVGTSGELCIGGTGIARGYFNQPEQTAQRFIANPFRPNTRLYRTGDLARFLPTGDIEFLGRIDQQIKIRGFRVEPAEIETALCLHPAIRQAAVIPAIVPNEDKVLVAYVVSTKKLEPAEWRAFLSGHLPDYMLPSRLVHIESLPLTPNGKVDTRALAAIGATEAEPVHQFTGPRNAEEEKMSAIWAEILKLERVGIHDNFFEMGGHSLLATQIIARIRGVFKVQFPLHSFLQTPTIAKITEKLAEYPAIENEEETLARLLQELEGISEEEAQVLLAVEMGKDRT